MIRPITVEETYGDVHTPYGQGDTAAGGGGRPVPPPAPRASTPGRTPPAMGGGPPNGNEMRFRPNSMSHPTEAPEGAR